MTRREDKARLADVKALLVEDGDFTLRPLVQVVLQEMLGAEMTEALEAEQGERTPTHLGYRAGYFPSTLVTRVSFEMKLETLKPRLEPALGLSALRGP